MNLLPIKLQGLDAKEQKLAKAMMDHLSNMGEEVEKAAACWVQLQPETQQRFLDSTPSGVRDMWGRLDRIGNRELHPLLWNANGYGAKALAQLPLDAQGHFLTHKIPVLVENELRELSVTELSAEQCSQVFKRSGEHITIRDYQQQRRWLRDREKKRELEEAAGLEKMQTRKINRRGKWTIEKGLAHVSPALNREGIDLEMARALVRDLQAVRRP